MKAPDPASLAQLPSLTPEHPDPPEIERPPQPVSVKNGGIAAFYCHAAGEPAPNFIWKKNGKKLRYTDSR